MKTYYDVSITKTGKTYGHGEYNIFDQHTETLATLKEAMDYLKEKYGNCKRVKLYRDDPSSEPYQSGWIYCFNNSDMSHSPVEKWHQQDWVEVNQVESTIVLPGSLS